MYSIRRFGFVLICAVAALTAQRAEAQQAPAAIYSDGLAAGWENWSWADVVLGVRSDGGERPIQVTASGWQALYFHHAPISTTGYETFSFWINGGPQGGQTISVVAVDPAGNVIADRVFLFTPPTNDWARVDVRLRDLQAADRSISGFWIQNGAPDPAPVFFVNEAGLFPPAAAAQ